MEEGYHQEPLDHPLNTKKTEKIVHRNDKIMGSFASRPTFKNKKSSIVDQDLMAPISNAIFFKHFNKKELKEDYIVGKVIGQGAYGKVKLATHKKSGMVRAVKQIRKKMVENQEDLFQEVEILLALDHPNIVKLFGLYEDKKSFTMVTE
jgi:serine/threonine protein kinase